MLSEYREPLNNQPRGVAMVTPVQIDDAIRACEAVGGHLAVHAIGDGAVRMVLDALGERGPGETDDAQRRIVEFRRNGLVFDGQPDLKGRLCREAMEPKCREQANDALRYPARHFGQRSVGRDRAPWKSIQSPPNPFKLPTANCTGQRNPWDTQWSEVAGTYQSLIPHQVNESLGSRIHALNAVAFQRHVSITADILAHEKRAQGAHEWSLTYKKPAIPHGTRAFPFRLSDINLPVAWPGPPRWSPRPGSARPAQTRACRRWWTGTPRSSWP